jgi:hypothetical protein
MVQSDSSCNRLKPLIDILAFSSRRWACEKVELDRGWKASTNGLSFLYASETERISGPLSVL